MLAALQRQLPYMTETITDKANSPEQAFSYIRRRGRFTRHSPPREPLERYRTSPKSAGRTEPVPWR